jgi:RNA-directed DNA polymerase
LDWWISDQWETFESRYTYSTNGSKYQHLKKTALKECFIVRYADDFKIMCRTRSQAIRMNYAVRDFLKNRIHLETSEEKSKIINLKKNSSEFLGFSIKAVRKGKTRFGYVARSDMSKKAKLNAFQKIKEAIKVIKKKPCIQAVWNFNTVVMGIQNYYSVATNITINLNELNAHLRKTLYNQLRNIRTEASFHEMTKTLQKRYKGYKTKLFMIQKMVFVPIHAQRWKKTLGFSQVICNFTAEGRAKIHNSLKAIDKSMLSYIMRNYIPNRTIEYNDNRISKFIAQYGKCAILVEELGINEWHCHHISPYYLSKDDSYSNLIIVHKAIHQLIHLKDKGKIETLLQSLKLTSKQKEKVNKLRLKCLNEII